MSLHAHDGKSASVGSSFSSNEFEGKNSPSPNARIALISLTQKEQEYQTLTSVVVGHNDRTQTDEMIDFGG